MDTTHFGITPTTLVNAILTALTAQLSSVVPTIGRIRDTSKEGIAAVLRGGGPAILVFYQGGVYATGDAGGGYDDHCTFKIYCVSGRLTNITDRQSEGQIDPASATLPGVEEMQDWAVWIACRALIAADATRVRPTKHSQVFRIAAEHFMGSVEIIGQRKVDLYDDTVSASLQTLGIVHDPTAGYASGHGAWWEADNETPISDWPPPGVDGGVADL